MSPEEFAELEQVHDDWMLAAETPEAIQARYIAENSGPYPAPAKWWGGLPCMRVVRSEFGGDQ